MECRATVRDLNVNPNVFRRSGQLPAVLYGHGFETVPITLKQSAFRKLFLGAGKSTLIDLVMDDGQENAPMKVLVHDVQVHPVTREYLHADLYRIRMDEKIHTTIPLIFINESPAVTQEGGVLIKQKDALEVECLPMDLVPSFPVDLSALQHINDTIFVRDVVVNEAVRVFADPQEAVVIVVERRVEKEETPLASQAEEGETSAEAGEASEGDQKAGSDTVSSSQKT